MEVIDKTVQIRAAHALVDALELNDLSETKHHLAILTQTQESYLFHKVEKTIRDLHESINNFSLDSHPIDLTEDIYVQYP